MGVCPSLTPWPHATTGTGGCFPLGFSPGTFSLPGLALCLFAAISHRREDDSAERCEASWCVLEPGPGPPVLWTDCLCLPEPQEPAWGTLTPGGGRGPALRDCFPPRNPALLPGRGQLLLFSTPSNPWSSLLDAGDWVGQEIHPFLFLSSFSLVFSFSRIQQPTRFLPCPQDVPSLWEETDIPTSIGHTECWCGRSAEGSRRASWWRWYLCGRDAQDLR